MRISQIIWPMAAAGWFFTAPLAQAQSASAYLAVQGITSDAASSQLHVIVKNVGQQKITGCGVLVGGQQYSQEFIYAMGMEAKLTLPRPPGFGGIQPGETVDLVFPLPQGSAPTAQVNAVILEDRTAVGDEAEMGSMFRQRQGYAEEWAHWASAMQDDPSHYRLPEERERDKTEMLRVLRQDPDERGEAATIAGRMAARRALAALLAQDTAATRAAVLEHLRERAVVLMQHAQRAGLEAFSQPALGAKGRPGSLKPTAANIRTDQFSCGYSGQSPAITGQAGVQYGANTARRSTAKDVELSVTAAVTCGVTVVGVAPALPVCNPGFFTTTSASPPTAMIMGITYSFVGSLGCTIAGSQSKMRMGAETEPLPAFAGPGPCPEPPPVLSCSPTTVTRGGTINCSLNTVPAGAQWSFTGPNGTNVAGPSGVGQWGGTMAIGGTITVAFTNYPSQTATITVNNRSGFGTSAASSSRVANGTQEPNCSSLSVPDPPQSGGILGVSCPQLPGQSWNTQTIGGGPNQGYTYLTSLTYSEGFFYTITPQLLSTGSAFYTAQCGNYNPTTNPNGYISGALLLTNVAQHEGGTPGHYGQYLTAQGSASNNLGILAEATVTAPGANFSQTVQQTLTDAQSRIQSATISDAALCGGNATEVPPACTFNGYVNYPPYAACH